MYIDTMERKQVYIKKEDHDIIAEHARREGRSIVNFVQWVIKKYIKENNK